jgi:hypothetical protein
VYSLYLFIRSAAASIFLLDGFRDRAGPKPIIEGYHSFSPPPADIQMILSFSVGRTPTAGHRHHATHFRLALCTSLEPVAEREFPDWIMGFEAVAPAEAARLLDEPLVFDSACRIARIEARSAKTLFQSHRIQRSLFHAVVVGF